MFNKILGVIGTLIGLYIMFLVMPSIIKAVLIILMFATFIVGIILIVSQDKDN